MRSVERQVGQLQQQPTNHAVPPGTEPAEPYGVQIAAVKPSSVMPRTHGLYHQPLRWRQVMMRSVALLATVLTAGTASALLAVNLPLPGVSTPDEGRKLLSEWVKSGFQYQISRPITVLVMGIDRVLDAPEGSDAVFEGRSDTMLLLRLDPETQTVNLLSIPRDTQVEIPGVGLTKINHANASGGPLLARETVSQTLNGIQIDRYVRVSTDAFRELVDLLGGVRVYVPKPMQYEDQTQKLKIDLQPGWQTLTGDQAEQFARFRHDNFGDIGRVQRQQALLKALKEQVSHPLTVVRIPGILRTMQKYVETNLSFEEMLALVNFGLKLEQKDFKMVLLPGRFSAPDEFRASYWIMDPRARDRIMQEYFQQASIGGVPEETPPTALRIAVQNAADDPEAAAQVAQHLHQLGYGNVFVTDAWSESEKQTQLIVQGGQLHSAQMLQKLLEIGTIDVASTGDIESDVTLRVGNDWQKLRFW